MATFKLVLSPYEKKNGTHSIDLRITIDRKPKPTPTGYYVLPKQWDDAKERVKANHPNFIEINDALDVKVQEAEKAYAKLDKTSKPTSKQVAKLVSATHDFYAFAKTVIDGMRKEGKIGPADKKESHISNLKKYAPELAVEHITQEFLSDYKKWFKTNGKNEKGVKHNTVVSNLATLRSIYNLSPYKAHPSPFVAGSVGSYRKSGDMPLTSEDIERIWNYIPGGKWDAIARKSFLISFYALGLRSGDVLTLEWPAIGENEIIVEPGKTSESTEVSIYIPMHARLRELINSLDRSNKTLFGLITTNDPVEKDRQLMNTQTEINKQLKLIALRCGIMKPIKFKLARTTFADIANKKTNRNIYGIQQAMGHAKVSTTEIYLGDDRTAIDELVVKVYG